MGRNGAKAGGIYIGLYMSIFMEKGFSYPLKVFFNWGFIFWIAQGLGHLFWGSIGVIVAGCYKGFAQLSTSFGFGAVNFAVAAELWLVWGHLCPCGRAPRIINGAFETSSGFVYASLLLINTLPFTCGERKICSTIKKSQNIMNIIIVKIFFYLLCLYKQLSL